MKIIAATDSFKGSLSSAEACHAIALGAMAVSDEAEVIGVPLADGGEGTVEAYLAAKGGAFVTTHVSGLFGEGSYRRIYGVSNETAIIETAEASGITLVKKEELDPLRATTFATGELIAHALDNKFRKIIIGLGGSATNDGGAGALTALGVRFKNSDGEALLPCGGNLCQITEIDVSGIHPALAEAEITLACDVNAVFYGENGAAYIFSPQKGASPEQVEYLDKGLQNLAEKYLQTFGKDISMIRGAGAAGGLSGGLMAATNAKIVSGFEIIKEAAGLEKLISAAELVITGEGMTDAQTALGKLPAGVAKIASKYKVPVLCLSGGVKADDKLFDCGLTAVFGVSPALTPAEKVFENAFDNLRFAAAGAVRFFMAAKGMEIKKDIRPRE